METVAAYNVDVDKPNPKIESGLKRRIHILREAKRAKEQEALSWLKLHKKHQALFIELKGAGTLYLYMVWNINRGWHTTFADLGKYFQNGILAFGKNVSFIAEDFGVNERTIQRHLKILRDKGMIVKIGEEVIRRGQIFVTVDIYMLGRWEPVSGKRTQDAEKEPKVEALLIDIDL